MANISSIGGNPIVIGASGIEDGSVTAAKLDGNIIGPVDKQIGSIVGTCIGDEITLGQAAAGYKLLESHICTRDDSYSLKKYQVRNGTVIFMLSRDNNMIMQFQNDQRVPASGQNTYVVGDDIETGYSGPITVPSGATYLIVSTRNDDDKSKPYLAKNISGEYSPYDHQLSNETRRDFFEIETHFEQGTINERVGSETDSQTRLRGRKYIKPLSRHLYAETGDDFQWYVIEYDSVGAIIGYAPTWIYTNTVYSIGSNTQYVRFVVRRTDNGSIAPSDVEGCKFYSVNIFDVDYSNYEQVDRYQTVDGYGLNYNELVFQDSNYALYKYYIGGYSNIKIVSNHRYQFQSTSYVPATGVNTGVVGGQVKGLVDGIVEVPSGATYIIVSVDKTLPYEGAGVYVVADKDELNRNVTMSVSPVLASARYSGHRGGGKNAPENTIPSLDEGYENGFKLLEVDIQFTSDGVPVVIHDETINRTGRNADGTAIDGDVYVRNLTYDELSEYDFGIAYGSEYVGTRAPSLEDVILWAKRHGCCLELDLYGTYGFDAIKAETIYDLLVSYGVTGSCLITSYISRLELMLGLGDLCVCCSGIGTTESSVSATAAILKKAMYAMGSMQYPYTTADQVKLVHRYGIKAKGFTVSSSSSAEVLWGYGVDKMILHSVYPSEIDQGIA